MIDKSLEDRIREGKLSRRDFLKIGGSALLTSPLLKYCKRDVIETPTIVNLQFDVYKDMEGYKGSYGMPNVMSGDNVNINIQNDLINKFNITGVDSQRVTIRNLSSGQIGSLATYSNNGTATFSAPHQNTNYAIFLFPSGPPYNEMDAQGSKLYKTKRNYSVYRRDFDGQVGDDTIWKNAIYPINSQILRGHNIPYTLGVINLDLQATSGDFSVGFGNCDGADGCSYSDVVLVNWNKYPNSITFLTSIAIEELFEHLNGVNNIGWSTGNYVVNNGKWTDTGVKLMRFAFLKDRAN